MAPYSSDPSIEMSPKSTKSSLATPLKPEKGPAENKDVKIAEGNPIRVEPKSYFANERTFIQWLSAGLLLLTVSSIMMGNGEYFKTAALISFSALILVAYATFTYFRRIKLLSSGKGYGYVDHIGPFILAAGVGVGVFIVFIDVMRASEMFGFKGFGDRRLDINVRRLESIPAMYEEAGKCFQHPMTGINTLKYQPGDAIVDEHTHALLVASTQEIVSHPLEGGEASHLVKLPDTDLNGLTAVGDRIFALSGGPHRTELVELAWGSDRDMEVQGRWTITESVTRTDSLTFVPDGKDDTEGQLYMVVDGSMNSYQVPSRGNDDPSSFLTLVDSINMKVLYQGLGEASKIGAMHYFEGVTYLLHPDRKVLHAWDLQTGAFLAEISLPHLDNSISDEWRGMALERRVVELEGSLRGSSGDDVSSVLLLHLTLDEPAQIWTFAVQEGGTRGSFIFPDCAAATAIN